MKKVLILGYDDLPQEGHALSVYKKFSAMAEAYILCCVSRESGEDINSFYDSHEKGLARLKYWLYLYNAKRRFIINKKNKKFDSDQYCYFNSSGYYAKNAKQILDKSCKDPDIIVICWHDFLISPITINRLYRLTKAQVVILMVDPHIITGGCHYPNECKQYITGCKSCPALINARVAENLFNEKVEYLSDIPLILVGTSFDLNRAKESPFLNNKRMVRWIGIPSITLSMEKSIAREKMGIGKDDFVIMAGGASLYDKRKGFNYIYEALKQFNGEVTYEKDVTFLLLGNGSKETLFCGDRVKIKRPGFLDKNGLITAFYAADVFCSASIDDSGPYMINYSIACCTPVISFPVGIALDLVKHKETGYLADYKSSKSIKDGLSFFYKLTSEECSIYANNCRQMCDDILKEDPWYEYVLKMCME